MVIEVVLMPAHMTSRVRLCWYCKTLCGISGVCAAQAGVRVELSLHDRAAADWPTQDKWAQRA